MLNGCRVAGLLSIYFVFFGMIWSCEEDVEPTISDPLVSIFFLNQGSLAEVNVIIDSLNEELVEYDSILTALEKSADLLADSLIILADSIAKGGDLKDDSVIVQNDLDTLNVYFVKIEQEDSAVNANQSLWSGIASTINSGSVRVSSIVNNKNGQSISYEDSSTLWYLPLDMQGDEVDVDIVIADQAYNLVLGYSRKTKADEKNKVFIETSDFEIISTDFNNPYFSCNGCVNSNTTIYVEF